MERLKMKKLLIILIAVLAAVILAVGGYGGVPLSAHNPVAMEFILTRMKI